MKKRIKALGLLFIVVVTIVSTLHPLIEPAMGAADNATTATKSIPSDNITKSFPSPKPPLKEISNIPMPYPDKGNPKIDTFLYRLILAEKKGEANAFTQLGNVKLVNGKVRIEIQAVPGQIDMTANVTARFGTVEAISRTLNVVQAVVPITSLTALAGDTSVHFARIPVAAIPTMVTEGDALVNADDWHNSSFNGAGVKIGIIDVGFLDYAPLLGAELPSNVMTHWAPSVGNEGTSNHGTNVAEIIYDVAPGSQVYLANFVGIAEFDAAVDWFIAQRVTVISSSVVFPAFGPGDGTGPVGLVVDKARNAGILWSQSAGNYAQQHWQGLWVDSDQDTNHEFVGNDETNAIDVYSDQTIISTLNWNDTWGASGNDYDLFLYDNTGYPVAYGLVIQDGDDDPYESLTYVATYTGYYYLEIRSVDSNLVAKDLRLYSFYHEVEIPIASGSIAVPADSPNAMAVGAVHWNTTSTIETFSSRGPTTDSRVKPDLVSPDGVSTVTSGASDGQPWPLGTGFFGTSAAAPHAAGAAALVKQMYLSYSPAQIQNYLETWSLPRGDPGKDNIFGSGLLWLPVHTITSSAGTGGSIFPSGSVVVARDSNKNFTITASTGYQISNVLVDGVPQGAVGIYTFLNVVGDHTISASFTQTNAPSVTTNSATSITSSSATLNGNLTSLGSASSVSVSFEWGLTTSYGNTTAPETKTTTGSFSRSISGLAASTTYHFRAKAVGDGTGYGNDLQFTTSSGGSISYVTLIPNADVAGQINIPIAAPSGAHYLNIDDPVSTPDEDNTRLQTYYQTESKDFYELSDVQTPPGNYVDSVTVYFRFRKYADTDPDAWATPYLRLGGIETNGTPVQRTATGYATYSQVLSRPGGGAWNVADIDNLQVGIGLRVSSYGASYSFLTQVYVVVQHSP